MAVTVGIPILSSVAATQSLELTGIRLALSADAAVTLISVGFIWFGLRPRGERRMAVAAVPVWQEAYEELAATSD